MMVDLSGARCISLWQPYASAVSLGLKTFETRSWSTSFRGTLFIHAAARWTREQQDWWIESWDQVRAAGVPVEQFAFYELTPPLGCVVAVVDLVECWPTSSPPCLHDFGWRDALPELERFFGDFSPGRHAWKFENLVRLAEPVPCRGRQGLWVPEPDVRDRVRDQMMQPT